MVDTRLFSSAQRFGVQRRRASAVRCNAWFDDATHPSALQVSRTRRRIWRSYLAWQKSVPPSKAARAFASTSCQVPRCSSPTPGKRTPSPDRREQTLCDACPRPALLDGAAARISKGFVVGGREGEDRLKLPAKVGSVAPLEGDEMAKALGELLFDPGCDLGQAGVARDERR